MAQGQVRSNEIYQKDLYDNYVESAKLAVEINDSLQKTLLELTEKFKQLGIKSVKEVKELTEAEKKLDDTTKSYNETKKIENKLLKQIQAQQQKLADSKTEEAKTIAKIRVEIQEQNKANKEAAKQELGLLDAYQEKSKRLNKLRKDYKALLASEGKATKETKKLAKEVDKLDRELKDIDASAGQFQRNVGNYPQTFGKATGSILKMAAAAAGLSVSLDGVKGALESNEEGADELAEATGFLDGLLSSAKSSAGSLFLSIKDLVTGAKPLPVILGQINNNLSTSFDRALDTGNAYSKAASDARNFAKEVLPLNEEIQELTNEIAIQNQIAGDQTKSFDEIAAAAQKAQRAEIKRAKILFDINKAELDIIKLKIGEEKDERALLGLKIEQSEKLIEKSQLQNELDLARLENTKILKEVEQDRFERQLDFAIDAFDAQKTLSERIIADTTKEFDVRSKTFLELKALQEDAFLSQKQLIDAQIGGQLDLDALVNETSERRIRQLVGEVQTSDVVKGRILEFVRETKTVRQDLADSERDLREESKENAAEATNFINDLEQAQFEGQIARLEGLEGEEENIYQLKRQRLISQAEFEKSLDETTAEEKLVIEQELQNELDALEREELKRKEELAEKEKQLAEEAAQAEKDALDARIDQYSKFVNDTANILSKLDEFEQDRLDKRLQRVQTELDIQQDRANQGLRNTLNDLRQQQAEIQAEQDRLARRALIREKALAAFNLLAANAKAGEPNPAVKTFAQIALVETLAQFYDGTEALGVTDGSKPSLNTNRDAYVARLQHGERIMPDYFNEMTKMGNGQYMPNEDLAKLAYDFNTGQLGYSVVNQNMIDVTPIVSQQAKTNQLLKNIEFNVNIDSDGIVTKKQVIGGLTKISTNGKRRLP